MREEKTAIYTVVLILLAWMGVELYNQGEITLTVVIIGCFLAVLLGAHML